MVAAKQILFATDYSEPSQYALHFATSLARDCQAGLLIVHVSDLECYPVGELVDKIPGPSAIELSRMEEVVPDDISVPFEQRVICPPPTGDCADPAKEIIRVAQQEHVDAIVIGTHGRTGLARLLVGSVAESVMRKAPCPVVTVRKPNS